MEAAKKFKLFHGRRIDDIIAEIDVWLRENELRPTNESVDASFSTGVLISVIVSAQQGGYDPLTRYIGSQGNIEKINRFIEQEINGNEHRTILRTKVANAGRDHVVIFRYHQIPIPVGTNAVADPPTDPIAKTEPIESPPDA